MIPKVLDNKKLVNASIILMGFSLVAFILYQFKSFLMPFTVAIILTFLLIPTYRKIKQKKIYKIYLAISIILIVLLAAIFSTLAIRETRDINIEESANSAVELYDTIKQKGIQFGGNYLTFEEVLKNEDLRLGIQKITTTFFGTIGDSLLQFAIVILFLMFMLPSHDPLIESISRKMDKKSKEKFTKALYKIEEGISDYLIIKSKVSAITAIVSLIVMLILGVKYPILFTILIFILNFIPNIGSFIAVGAVLISHFFSVAISINLLLTAILLILVQIIMGNIIEPKISGAKMKISPVTILLSLFFWGYIWGAWGMFFAVPLTVSIRIVIERLVNDEN